MENKTIADAEVAAFNEKYRRMLAEHARVDELVAKYQKKIPEITAQWDISANSVDRNDINSDFLKEGVSIFACSMADL